MPGRPVRWEGGTYLHKSYTRSFDLDPDGERLLVRKRPGAQIEKEFDSFVLFENFLDYLEQKVPTAKD